jgi:hypothetical protein
MSRYYSAMSAAALRDELDRLEENLSELEYGDTLRIGIQNRIYYICETLCRREKPEPTA